MDGMTSFTPNIFTFHRHVVVITIQIIFLYYLFVFFIFFPLIFNFIIFYVTTSFFYDFYHFFSSSSLHDLKPSTYHHYDSLFCLQDIHFANAECKFFHRPKLMYDKRIQCIDPTSAQLPSWLKEIVFFFTFFSLCSIFFCIHRWIYFNSLNS